MTPRKAAFRAADSSHGVIVHDLGEGRLAVLVGDLDACGPAVYDTSPIGLLGRSSVQALRDYLTGWLKAHPLEEQQADLFAGAS